MFRELWAARELTLQLIGRDVTGRYRQSILGWLWAFLPAIGTTVLFTYLRDLRVLSLREVSIPYPAYVLLGMVSWQFFQGGLTAATQSLTAAGGMVSKLRFPRESLVLAAVGVALADAVLRTLMVACVFAWYGIQPEWTVVLAPLVLVPLVVLTMGLGLFLALFNALVRDVSAALPVGLSLFFFLVPVLYPPPVRWPHVLLNDLNPVAVIMIAVHDVVVLGYLTRPAAYAAASLIAVLVFFLAWRLFRMAQPFVAERI